jgi:hypothetical protein
VYHRNQVPGYGWILLAQVRNQWQGVLYFDIMLNDIIIINATISTHNSLTHGSTHSEDGEANKTNKHISLRGDPVSDDLCFFYIKVSLGPREICEQACNLATDQQYGRSSQNFHYLDSIYMLWVHIHSLIWKATVHTLSLWL